MPNTVLPSRVEISATMIGPLYDEDQVKGKSRETYPHRLNESISTVDRIIKVDTIPIKNAGEIVEYTDEKKFTSCYEEMIMDHVERRVAVLFQQLVISYRTFLHFEIGKTLHQGESAKRIYLQNRTGKKIFLCRRNAAHSSTLPCIVAFEGRAWKRHVENGEAKPDGFVYVQGGDIYRTANSTLNMPRAINLADIEIDGDKKRRGLARDYAIELLNKSATGEVDPAAAIKEFLDRVIIYTRNKVQSTKLKAGVNTVLKYFDVAFSDIKARIDGDPDVFDQLLGVQVLKKHLNTPIQQKIYHLRYKAIRDNQYAQTNMIANINRVKHQVLKVVGPKRKPAYFDEAFQQILCDEMRLQKDKSRVYKLFNCPHEHHLRCTKSRMTNFKTIKNKILQRQIKPIQDLAIELGHELRNLKREEVLRRGLVTRELRHSMRWTQSELARRIKAIYHKTAASQPTISRIENNIKIVDKVYAKQLAHVFNVDVALLIPSFFYE